MRRDFGHVAYRLSHRETAVRLGGRVMGSAVMSIEAWLLIILFPGLFHFATKLLFKGLRSGLGG